MYKIEEIKNKILQGDTLTELKKIPSDSIDMVIFSPPYYGLRNYQTKGQIGLEPTFQEYLNKMIEIMREVKRVIKPIGTIWVNIGDCYGGSLQGYGASKPSESGFQKPAGIDKRYPKEKTPLAYMRPKCLLMQPERFAIRCIDELGLILRNKIVWAKQVLIKKENHTMGSVMPSSVKDRFNESYEFLYFFVKNKKYYSNLDAVRLPPQSPIELEFAFNYRVRDAIRKAGQPQFRASEEEITSQIARKYGYDPEGICPICGRKWKRHASPNASDRKAGIRREFVPCLKKEMVYQGKYKTIEEEAKYRQGMHKQRGLGIVEKRYNLPPQKEFVDKLRENFTVEELVKKTGLPKTKIEHWFRYDSGFAYPSAEDWAKVKTDLFPELLQVTYETDAIGKKYQGKFAGKQDAEMYGSPRARTQRTLNYQQEWQKKKQLIYGNDDKSDRRSRVRAFMDSKLTSACSIAGKNLPTVWNINPEPHSFQKELGIETEHFAIYPKALCEIPIKFGCPPDGIVLDPFMGSGTTAIVAKKLGRNFIGIEINANYCKLARKRLSKVEPNLFTFNE